MENVDAETLQCELCGQGKATLTCESCGKAICEQDAEVGGGRHLCRSCSYRSALGSAREYATVREKAFAKIDEKDHTVTSKRRRIVDRIVFGAVLIGTAFALYPLYGDLFGSAAPYAVGDAVEGPGLAECVTGLWEVQDTMGQYRYEHGGKLPPNLGALPGGAPGECPGCGEAWAYEAREDGGYRVACPRPSEHEQAAVFITDRCGPPQVWMSPEEVSP